MAMKITDECINCAACEPECPNEAIFEGEELYEVIQDKCTECVGHHDEPQCIEVCPIDEAIVIDPKESKEVLQARFEALDG